MIKKIANLFSGFPTTAIAGSVHVGLLCESVPATPGFVHVPGDPAGSGIVTFADLYKPKLFGSSVPSSMVISVLACFRFVRLSLKNAPPHIPEDEGMVRQVVREPLKATIWVGARQSAEQVAGLAVTLGS